MQSKTKTNKQNRDKTKKKTKEIDTKNLEEKLIFLYQFSLKGLSTNNNNNKDNYNGKVSCRIKL